MTFEPEQTPNWWCATNRRFFRHGKLSGSRCLGWPNLNPPCLDLVGISLRTFRFEQTMESLTGNERKRASQNFRRFGLTPPDWRRGKAVHGIGDDLLSSLDLH
jgi:hypothetical protein